MSFLKSIQEAAKHFKELPSTQPIRIISNKDTDGITAAAILIAALQKEQKPNVVTLIKQLTEDYLDTLKQEQYTTYFFIDMGASYLDIISKKLPEKNIFVLDHHYPDTFVATGTKIMHLNPHLHDIDGTKNISASGVTYFFAKALNEKNTKLAHLAIIGSIGDMQEDIGFTGFNADILQDAEKAKTITVTKGLRLFGIHTKPLYKFLMNTTNPYIPTVTGNEKGSLHFLQNIGINPKIGSKFKWASELPEKDLENLYNAIMAKQPYHQKEPLPKGPLYFLPQEKHTSPTYDAAEYSTLINACGKMGQPTLGIGVCLGDEKLKEKALLLLQQYHNEIITCMSWYHKNKGTEHIKETENYIIINAENSIRDGLIGTLVSMISKSHLYPEGTVLIGLATMLSDEIKVSMRICGFKETTMDLRKIVKLALKKTRGQGGGHRLAAGAILPAGKGKEFVETCTMLLEKALIEETV
tara:strand:+ start:25824 stop:27230 length:1407 start_codon:yes stop_codon:yes gene_type:complete